jgi:NNP family nitrate/nitrite transporter-like MFS transporter
MTQEQMQVAKDSRFEWLLGVAILSGSLLRLNFGIWADRYGGRNMMILLLLLSSVPTYWVSQASSYTELLICAALFGLAGNSFSVGIAWNSAWFPNESKGLALGIFGAGNVGASGTKLLIFFVPAILTLIPVGGYLGGVIPGEWRFIPALYSVLLVLMAIAIFLLAPKEDRKPGQGRSISEMLRPLQYLRVWRFSLYYVVVFGAYVALAGWLPSYYEKTYGTDQRMAALCTALFIFPASLLRPLGGYLSDRHGPRVVTYCVFIVMTISLIALSVVRFDVWTFTLLLFVVGICMGVGKASVYKYIPNYFPRDIGAVGGLVGMLGALGGFMLPKLFGTLGRETGSPQAAFFALTALTIICLLWLHLVVMKINASERMPSLATAP